MDMMLNDILRLNMDQIANSRIELNMNSGIGGEAFIDKLIPIVSDYNADLVTYEMLDRISKDYDKLFPVS